MTQRIALLVNPIAGMGGRVGLKGTDGVVSEAVKRGATPQSSQKAIDAIKEFQTLHHQEVSWITCAGAMGEDILKECGIFSYEIVYTSKQAQTTKRDTKKACEIFFDKSIDLLVFCGGDGTARDIVSVVKKNLPLLGIPAGVKMHSGVFGINPKAAGKMIHAFLEETLTVGDVDIMDLDEEQYRRGTWHVKLFDVARGIIEPTYVQVGKSVYAAVSDETIIDELAEHIQDEMKEHDRVLYLFGAGGTINAIAEILGIKNSLLGIDAVYQGKVIKADVNEQDILSLLKMYPKMKVIVSPIGAQGFILGRGNLQLSPPVINAIGLDNIIVVSTPEKIRKTPMIRVDTGDEELDKQFIKKEFIMVVIGYRLSRVMHMQTNSF